MASKNNYNVREDILRGVKAGRMQTVGNMQVIPLLLDMDEDQRFAAPKMRFGTRTYGTVQMQNLAEKDTITPCHTAIFTKQYAQNHALMSAELVNAQAAKIVNTAACIQQRQGGVICSEETALDILPYALREEAISRRKEQSFGKLWPAIQAFNRTTGVSKTGGHLEYFIEMHKQTMEQFVAEFECLPGQVGAIVLIDGVVMGIERAPNQAYWQSIWEPLIRTCYGSQSIVVGRSEKKAAKSTIPNRVPLKGEIKTLSDLSAALDEAEAAEERNAKDVVRRLLDDPFAPEKEQTFILKSGDSISLETLTNDQFVGQIVTDGPKVCYASLVARKGWASKQAWREAAEFSL